VTKGDEEMQEESISKYIINLYFSNIPRFLVDEKKVRENVTVRSPASV
jgi:hypothetical protein